ncbi:Plasmodium vivax Vir protein, putative, partial [Plasmodium vivax]
MADSIENIIIELTSSKIYDELSKDPSESEYKSKHCDNLKDGNDQMKDICKKMARNIKTLSNNSEMNGLGHRDRCRYLNFWIYGEISKLHTNEDKNNMKDICKKMANNIESLRNNSKMNVLSYRDRCTYLNFWIYEKISKLYTNEDENLTDISDVAKLIDANIKINMDLIKDDFNKNNVKLMQQITNTAQTAQSTNSTQSQAPAKFVKHYELSKHEPCYFNYDCTFSECREMKHLFEYFKNYDEVNKKIDCEKRQKDKYYTYLKYMSYLYNKHKYEEECCSWGATVCSDYFLQCDEYYDPLKLISAIESNDQTECKKIKDSLIANKSEETSTIDPKEENNMYIKYLTCSRAT